MGKPFLVRSLESFDELSSTNNFGSVTLVGIMQLIVNGSREEIASAATVQFLLDQLGLEKNRLAVEVNGEIVPRSAFNNHVLQDGDSIEIVQAIGGG